MGFVETMISNWIFFNEIQCTGISVYKMGAFLDDDCCLDASPESRSLGVRIRCRYRLEGNLKMMNVFTIKQND